MLLYSIEEIHHHTHKMCKGHVQSIGVYMGSICIDEFNCGASQSWTYRGKKNCLSWNKNQLMTVIFGWS